MLKIDRNLRAQLIGALRSGRYRQTTRRLAEVTGDAPSAFCVLGLAAEVYRAHHEPKQAWHDGPDHRYAATATELPAHIWTAYGLQNQSRDIFIRIRDLTQETLDAISAQSPQELNLRRWSGAHEGRRVRLSYLNDLGVAFPLLADVLEQGTKADA